MNTNKPLTPEERDRLNICLKPTARMDGLCESAIVEQDVCIEVLTLALAAEAYWREKFASLKPIRHPAQGADDYECPGCGDYCPPSGCRKPDCPWLLARS